MKETDRERERQCGVFCTESKVTITANFLVACVTSETEQIIAANNAVSVNEEFSHKQKLHIIKVLSPTDAQEKCFKKEY
jgi:hypothetical protein